MSDNAHHIVKFLEMLDDELEGHGEDVATFDSDARAIICSSSQGVLTADGDSNIIEEDDVKRYAVVVTFEHERHQGMQDSYSFDVNFTDDLGMVPRMLLGYEDYSPTVFDRRVWDLETGAVLPFTRKVLVECAGFSAAG